MAASTSSSATTTTTTTSAPNPAKLEKDDKTEDPFYNDNDDPNDDDDDNNNHDEENDKVTSYYCPVVPLKKIYTSEEDHKNRCRFMFGQKYRTCPACGDESSESLTCLEYVEHKRKCEEQVECRYCFKFITWSKMKNHLYSAHPNRNAHHYTQSKPLPTIKKSAFVRRSDAQNKTTTTTNNKKLAPWAFIKRYSNEKTVCATCQEKVCKCEYCPYCKSSWKNINDLHHLMVCEQRIECADCHQSIKVSDKYNKSHICPRNDPMVECEACNDRHKLPSSQIQEHTWKVLQKLYACKRCGQSGIPKALIPTHQALCQLAEHKTTFTGPQFVAVDELIEHYVTHQMRESAVYDVSWPPVGTQESAAAAKKPRRVLKRPTEEKKTFVVVPVVTKTEPVPLESKLVAPIASASATAASLPPPPPPTETTATTKGAADANSSLPPSSAPTKTPDAADEINNPEIP
jgi:hypothetical protein